MTTMLDFYREHAVAPVKQDITDLQAHFQRRAFLYRQLGLWPMAIEGKHVLEVGPGTGENARYTFSLQPETYTLLEPNAKAREDLEAAFGKYSEVEIKADTIETYAGSGFDVVLCEGLLGLAGRDARGLLDALGEKVRVGGILVITCIDPISQCADVLRRALAQQYIKKGASLQENVEILKPIFAPHLATLKGMTRSVEDWIVDNILNPASIGPTFSIPDALTHVEGRFEVVGCSPRFLMDWRWYKEGQPGNAWAIESYWKNCHNLYDYRKVEPEKTVEENEELLHSCLTIRNLLRGIEQKRDSGVAVGEFSLETLDPAWFGRGQQYLSLERVG